MGLFNWVQTKLLGVDVAAEQQRGDALDKQLQDLNQEDLNSGHYTPEIYQQSEENIAKGKIDAQASVNEGYAEGFKEGVSNVKHAIGSTIDFPFKLIPWQVWVIAAIALFLYMGGGKKMKGILAR